MLRPTLISNQKGFSLIEVVLALMILSIIIAAALPSMSSYFTEQQIRNAQYQLETGVQKARKLSMSTQKAHRLHFTDTGYEIYDATIPEKNKAEPIDENTWGSGIQVREKIPDTPPRYELPEDWIFSSSGLCDPLRFRITLKTSWMEFSFHPLNGSTQEIEFKME